MTGLAHAARCTLGGALAVIGGLAAASPLAPVGPAGPGAPAALALTPAAFGAVPHAAVPAPRLPLGAEAHPEAQPMAAAPLRPEARALGSIPTPVVIGQDPAVRPEARPVFTAAADWDGSGEGQAWSVAAMRAIDAAPRDLRDVLPADIAEWCPGYLNNPPHLRAAFWVGAVSALVRYESTFNERAVGGGGAWIGLLQITPSTARLYGCDATTSEALKDGEANLACGIRIMAQTVARDGVVTAGGGGIAADWGPMSRESTRDRIRSWVRDQAYCKPVTAVMASLRPEARPEETVVVASIEPTDLVPALPR